MSNEKNNTPLIIIGAVVVIAVIGGWWLYSSGNSPKKPVANSNSVAKSNAGEAFKTAPAGAEPAWSKGAANATVTIEEFVDFACPQCAKATPVVQQARAAYGDRVRVVFRHFPLDIPAHKNAYDASRAAEAAGIQGKFWEMENLLFKNQSAWSPASLNPRPIFEEYAKQIGLDTVKFNDDLIGMMTTSRVDKDKVRGRAINVSSTPSVYLNNRLLSIEDITPDNLKKLIDAELAKSQTPAANSATNTNTNTPTS